MIELIGLFSFVFLLSLVLVLLLFLRLSYCILILQVLFSLMVIVLITFGLPGVFTKPAPSPLFFMSFQLRFLLLTFVPIWTSLFFNLLVPLPFFQLLLFMLMTLPLLLILSLPFRPLFQFTNFLKGVPGRSSIFLSVRVCCLVPGVFFLVFLL